MKVNIATCGRFHYHKYVNQLFEFGELQTFYYSHKITLQVSVPPVYSVNLPLKEYLTRAHIKILGDRCTESMFPLYHRVWERSVHADWRCADLWHFMVHGTSATLIKRAKRDGSMVLGEAVNTYPTHRYRIINEEREFRGLSQRAISKQDLRLIEELNACDHLLVPSGTCRDSLVQHGFKQSRVSVIPFGVDSRWIVDYRNPKFTDEKQLSEDERRNRGPLRVLCVGQISLRKGQLYLLEAAKRLGRSAISVTLIGRVSDEIGVLLNPYRDYFKHIEFVENAELPGYYSKSDVFVLPTLEEGMAVVLTEAVARGCAVITTRDSGIDGLLEAGSEYVEIGTRSTDDLVYALERFCDNRDLADLYSRAAVRKITDSSTWDGYAKSLSSLYNRMLRE